LLRDVDKRVHPGSRGLWLASPTVALTLGLFVGLALAAFAPILALARQLVLGSFTPVAVFLPCAAVGFVIARRRPSNPIGWLLLAGIGAGILGTDAGYYAWAAYGVRHGLPLGWLAVLVGESWSIILLLAFRWSSCCSLMACQPRALGDASSWGSSALR